MKNLLIFVFLCHLMDINNSEKSFIASFQSSGKWSPNEWMEYKGNIPSFFEFTACHWEKGHYFSGQINTVWSYCLYITKDDPKMKCVEVYYLLSSNLGSYIDFKGWIDGWYDETLYIVFKKVPYKHRAWNHFCWTYSNTTGISSLYHNGKRIGRFSLLDEYGHTGPGIYGSKNVHDAALIIGQEPDSMRGDYIESQAFPGDISELNIWDKILEEEEISSMANCTYLHRGNIVMWDKTKLDVSLVKILDIEESSMFCKQDNLHVIFPKKVTLKYGGKICSQFGGKISVPHSEEENEAVRTILNQHTDECIDGKNYKSTEKVHGIWLGAAEYENKWYEDKNLLTNQYPINYSNWYETYNLVSNVDNPCPYMFSDGTWGYGRGNVCKSLSLCVICSFSYVPLFTLKGQCKNSAFSEGNYYMSINGTNQIEFFDGISKNANISIDGGKWKKIGKSNSERMALNVTNYPIGRNDWDWADEACGSVNVKKKSFAFSPCRFGEEYTCDSGECVDMEKRCDAIYDCDDASDEEKCDHVEFPGTYIKSNAPIQRTTDHQYFPVFFSLIIEKVDFIDTLNMKIGLTFLLQLKWKDERLRHRNLHQYSKYTLSDTTSKKLWLPIDQIVHRHAIVGKIFTDGTKKVIAEGLKHDSRMSPYSSRENFVYFGEHINLIVSQRFRIQYNCLFKLQKYPFDDLFCEIGLKIEGKDHEKFLIVGDPSTSIAYLDSKSIEDFKIVGIRNNLNVSFQDGIYESSLDNGLIITILIKRSYLNQIVSIFCPSILFWVLAYCTLFLDIDDVNNRSRTSVTVLLVLLSLLQTVSKDFPKTTYFKCIDVWFLWYISNIFFIIFYQILLPSIKIRLSEMNNNSNKLTQVFPMPENEEDLKEERTCVTNDSTQGITKRINKALIILLPLMLIMFNIVYFSISL